jgi:hypothetical protein
MAHQQQKPPVFPPTSTAPSPPNNYSTFTNCINNTPCKWALFSVVIAVVVAASFLVFTARHDSKGSELDMELLVQAQHALRDTSNLRSTQHKLLDLEQGEKDLWDKYVSLEEQQQLLCLNDRAIVTKLLGMEPEAWNRRHLERIFGKAVTSFWQTSPN